MAETRPAPLFLADATALDFLNTRASPAGSEIEWIADGQDLVAWLQRIGAAPPEAMKALDANAVMGELDRVAAQARALREWFRGFVLARKGRRLETAHLTNLVDLNRLLSRDETYGSVGIAGGPDAREHHAHEHGAFVWRWHRRWTTPESLLQPIAQAMAEFICEADFRHVKHCEGPGCTLLFYDVTKGRARRWCSMGVCGNRAKQAAHRERVRSATKGSGRARRA